MNEPLLVLDCHYLCHRAFHAHRDLSWKGIKTGVIFGFFKSVQVLKHEFQTDSIAFCFEGKTLRRRDIYPDYKDKRSRQNQTPEERKARKELSKQIHQLRTDYLPRVGFRNVFRCDGYESDDLMASIAENYSRSYGGGIVLVTGDSDLYQCLTPYVQIYNPIKQVSYTSQWFRNKYKIAPWKWSKVKSICGCKSDNVPGIGGVGEITALKYLCSQLPRDCAAWKKIEASAERIKENRRLVKLPFKGCPVPIIGRDDLSEQGWREVCKSLGMGSIAHHMPAYHQSRGISRNR